MVNNSDKYLALRERYPRMEYRSYDWHVDSEGLHLCFEFVLDDEYVFKPTALVEARPFLRMDLPREVLDRLVFDIGMVELVSYWKCACPPTVVVSCGSLTSEQTAFWRKLYWHGLGEFFYTNGIATTPEAFVNVECGMRNEELAAASKNSSFLIPHSSLASTGYLVPIGGGKDSVVTLELLRRAGKEVRPLIMNPRGATRECARVAGFDMDEVLVIRRTIHPLLLELNSQGFLNGHTPFSAMLAFYTRLASVLSGVPNVALSNESSANESTVLGTDVNHQYSKSLEFEDDFRRYCFDNIECGMRNEELGGAAANSTFNIQHSTFNYFSFLRPLSELQIAMLFSRFTAYHAVFRSCNVGSKQDVWCGHCAKCLFAYIILSPFIAQERLAAIFGKLLLDDESLRPEFEQLLGLAETKPFECVGTVSEVRQALRMAAESGMWKVEGGECPALLRGLDMTSWPADGIVLDRLLPEGNLTAEEREILEKAVKC